MATLAPSSPSPAIRRSHGFFLASGIVIAIVNVAGFSLQHAMGRSSFGAPPIVHVHALVFFGWVSIYLFQNVFAATGSLRLHRRLGWLATGWMAAMVVLGITMTIRSVRLARVPFFFTPAYFMVMNPVEVLTFAGLSSWAIVLRRRTEWHKRLHLCGMATIMGPSLGRLLPAPLLIPLTGPVIFAAVLLLPMAGVIADWRRAGQVHPAWWAGIAVMLGAELFIEVIARTPIAAALYAAVAAGSAGAAVAPFAYPPFPPM